MSSNTSTSQSPSHYSVMPRSLEERRHAIAAIVDNEAGVLSKVIGLFSGRGYNIESLTVCSINKADTISRITIVTSGDAMTIEQIKAQLARLVPVHKVEDLTMQGEHIEKEIALVKIVASGAERREALRLANIFAAKVSDATLKSFVFTLSGDSSKIDAFVALMRALGKTEIARSGVVAINRGAESSYLNNENS